MYAAAFAVNLGSGQADWSFIYHSRHGLSTFLCSCPLPIARGLHSTGLHAYLKQAGTLHITSSTHVPSAICYSALDDDVLHRSFKELHLLPHYLTRKIALLSLVTYLSNIQFFNDAFANTLLTMFCSQFIYLSKFSQQINYLFNVYFNYIR